MKEKRLVVLLSSVCLVLLLVALPFMAACAKAPEVKPIELSLQYHISSMEPLYQRVFVPWIAEVEKRTEGRVKIVPYFEFALAPYGEEFDATAKGTTDIGVGLPGAMFGRFPATQVFEMMGPAERCQRPSRVITELYKEFPEIQKEFAAVKVLWLLAKRPQVILSAKPARTVADLKGLKLACMGPWTVKKGKAQGLAPVTCPAGDLYMNVQKGVMDGIYISADMLTGFRLEEVVDYVIEMPNGWCVFYVVMNLDKWNSLPPDIQKVFDDLQDWVVDLSDEVQEDELRLAKEHAAKEFGVEFITLSPEEMTKAVANDKPIRDEWVAEKEAMGLPAKKLLDEAIRLFKKYEKL